MLVGAEARAVRGTGLLSPRRAFNVPLLHDPSSWSERGEPFAALLEVGLLVVDVVVPVPSLERPLAVPVWLPRWSLHRRLRAARARAREGRGPDGGANGHDLPYPQDGAGQGGNAAFPVILALSHLRLLLPVGAIALVLAGVVALILRRLL